MKKGLILAFALAAGAFGAYEISREAESMKAGEVPPACLEPESVTAIQNRLKADFSLTRAELLARIREQHPEVTDADIDTFLSEHYIEGKVFDGEMRFHRKSPRNGNLLNPSYSGPFEHRGASASEARISYVDSVLEYMRGNNPQGLSHEVTYRFSVSVPYDPAIAGDTLRVWMPVPLETRDCPRQREVKILDAVPGEYVLSDGRSLHHTIYFEAPAPAEGDTARFEYVGKYVTSGAYVSAGKIAGEIKPYDTTGDIYTRYTRLPEGRHIVRMDSLAKAIVGDEKDPFRCSELVYDYIIGRYPWAGAREYSTISCIPEYVLREKHGDCGQVSLLYISLMRTLGIPARWESGWMLHPGEINLHDWSEVYFEGIGWVPVDISFGRYTGSDDAEVTGFYSHGIDSHRFATNKGVGDALFPPKRFVRSETVDFQLGEVETSKGNLYYPAWSSNLEIIEEHPIKE